MDNEDKFKAMFLLADMKYTSVFTILNEYTNTYEDPWFLFQTEYGLIKIGWRKRVIKIDWSDTKFRGIITKDDVTKSETYIHCWGYAKAVEYLGCLKHYLERE